MSKHISSGLVMKMVDLIDSAVPTNTTRFDNAIQSIFGESDRFKMKKSRKLFSIFRSRQYTDPTTKDEEKYLTSMHYYKRDLTPVKEIFASCNERTPYRSNFHDYEGSLISQGFKDELLKGLGEGVKCVTQSSGGNDAKS